VPDRNMYATTNLSVGRRPLRIGFLVRAGNVEHVVKAAGINTLLAGGIFNPLIPVPTRSDMAERLIDHFNVDVLTVIDRDQELETFRGKYPFLSIPFRVDGELFMEDWETRKNVPVCLDLLNIIDNAWETEFKHKPEDYQSNCSLLRWNETDEARNLFAVSFGFFPSSFNLRDDFEGTFLRGLRAKEISLQQEAPIEPAVSRSIYPLRSTALQMSGYSGSYLMTEISNGNGIYVGDANSFDDLVAFWNLRAAGLRVEFLPQNFPQRFEQFIDAHLQQLDKYQSQPSHAEDWITVHYGAGESNSLEEKIRLINEKHGPAEDSIKPFLTKKRLLLYHYDDWTWHERNLKPATFYFDKSQALANVEKRYERYAVTINLQEKPIVRGRRRAFEKQHLVASVQTLGELAYEEHTLSVPYIKQLNDFYGREIAFDPWKVRVEERGLGVIIDAADNHVSLFPIHQEKLLRTVLAHAGIQAELSQAGLITKRVIERLGGLENGRVFKIRGVRQLIHELKADDYVSKGEATHKIWADGQFKSHEDLYSQTSTDGIFETLLKKEIFRAGLELICDHCKLRNWLSLKDIDDIWTCTYCGHASQTSLQLKDRGDWRFRKSGLFAKDNNQEGAIPVILTLIQFLQVLRIRKLIYTPPLNLKTSSISCETDFCIMQYEGWPGIEIGIGECKSEKGKITRDDVENLSAVRENLIAKGFHCYLIFSKTADSFGPDEIGYFSELKKRKIPYILLLNKELEPYRLYDRYTEGQLPTKYTSSLQEMARNSARTYTPDDEENISGS
jgi:hypothetical protein